MSSVTTQYISVDLNSAQVPLHRYGSVVQRNMVDSGGLHLQIVGTPSPILGLHSGHAARGYDGQNQRRNPFRQD